MALFKIVPAKVLQLLPSVAYNDLRRIFEIIEGGKEIMPQPRGSKEVGYTGNGVVKITPLLMLGDYKTCMKRKASLSFVLFIVFIITKV